MSSQQTVMQRKGRKAQSLPIPKLPWESVSMDFITQLPASEDAFDAVMVVVDRLAKMAYFMPTTTTLSAMVAADLFFSYVFRYHELPKEIV